MVTQASFYKAMDGLISTLMKMLGSLMFDIY
jgi:hypothetical protein